jgi:hypothetical protein
VIRLAPASVFASVVLMVALTAGPASATPKLCANTYGGDVIYAKHLPCQRARQVVRAWARGYKRSGTPSVSALGFSCHGHNDEVEGLVIFCHRARKHIVFYANVP